MPFYLERLLPDPEVEEEPPLLLPPEPLELPEPEPAPGVTGLLVLLEPPLPPLLLSLELSLELSLLLLRLLELPELPELPGLLPLEPEELPEVGEVDDEEPEEASVALLPWVALVPLLLPDGLLPLLPEEPYCCWPWPLWLRCPWRWLRHWPNSSENLL